KTNGVTKSGYTVTLAKDGDPNTKDQNPVATCFAAAPKGTPASSYFANADPVTAGGTGTRYFATDTRGTIAQDSTAAIKNPLTLGAPGPRFKKRRRENGSPPRFLHSGGWASGTPPRLFFALRKQPLFVMAL